MNKTFLTLLGSLMISTSLFAKEKISIYFPYAASASPTPSVIRMVDEANNLQEKYNFQLVFKPGGNQSIAVNSMDREPNNSLSVIAPAYVENYKTNMFDKNNHVPIWSMGNACWLVISNLGDEKTGFSSLKHEKEINVGGVGFGNATHLTALALGEKYNIKVNYIVFKSNTDALMNMVGKNGINMVIDKADNYINLKEKGDLRALAVSCNKKIGKLNFVKTLEEQKITAPSVFNIIIANKNMPIDLQQDIKSILQKSAENIGQDFFLEHSGFRPSQFDKISEDMFYNKSLLLLEELLAKYKYAIELSKK
jgi:tripartite-type tricarboxylate transporter receptor subunit TctC